MRAPLIALSALVLSGVLAGLWTVGGPNQARSERRDAIRLDDLNALNWHLRCLDRTGEGLDRDAADCPERPRDHDPFTGELYRIEILSDGGIRLCAEFENDLPHNSWLRARESRAAPGCLEFQRPD